MYIRGGTYNQTFNLGTKHGTAGAPLTFAGYPGETVTVTGTSAALWWIQYTTNGIVNDPGNIVNYITFQNLIIDGSADLAEGADTGAYLDCHGVHDWTFDHVEIRNHRSELLHVDNGAYNIWVKNCHFHHNSTTAPGDFHRYYAMYIHDTSSFGNYGVLVEDSEFDHTVGPLVQISPGPHRNIIFRRNKLHDGQSQGYILNNNACGFIIASPTGGSSNIQIYNNLIYNTLPQPTTTNEASGIHISNGSNDVRVWNNTITGMRAGNTSTSTGNGGYGIWNDQGSGPNNIIQNNICYGNEGAGQIAMTVAGTADHNLITNPFFTNPSVYDYTLQANSPALNAGTTLAAVTTDYAGVARPQGAAYDIGAYERVAGDTTPPAVPTGLAVV